MCLACLARPKGTVNLYLRNCCGLLKLVLNPEAIATRLKGACSAGATCEVKAEMPRGGGGAGSSSGSKGAAPRGKQSDASKEKETAMAAQIIGPFENHGQCKLSMVNVTATADMKCTIDLKTVVMRARNAEYNPKRFSACIIRLINKNEPKATALVFKTGKVVVTGSRSNASVDYACKTFARILSKLDNGSGGPSHKINFDLERDRRVQNMVATTDVGFPIRLEGLVASNQGCFCNYEPELFPGLIYRMKDPKICFLIFVSGKVVLTGAKSAQQLEEGFKKMYPTLCQFKKATVLMQTSATARTAKAAEAAASASASTDSSSEPARKKTKA
ncbi:unnamed protein product [Ectocarpus fasciculatus]